MAEFNFAQARAEAEKMRNRFRAFEKIEDVLQKASDVESFLAKADREIGLKTDELGVINEHIAEANKRLSEVSAESEKELKRAKELVANEFQKYKESIDDEIESLGMNLETAKKEFVGISDNHDKRLSEMLAEEKEAQSSLEYANRQVEDLKSRL